MRRTEHVLVAFLLSGCGRLGFDAIADDGHLAGTGRSRVLHLDTTSDGADVAESIADFPLLVRLDARTLPGDALADGSDVRFLTTDGHPLPFELEAWDAARSEAEFWVLFDVSGNSRVQSLVMQWGADASPYPGSNGATVFRAESGFLGVWHLGEISGSDGAVVLDSSAAARHGTWMGAWTDPSAITDMIGPAVRFAGNGEQIVFPGPSPVPDQWTMSVWFDPDAPTDQARLLGTRYTARLSWGSSNAPPIERSKAKIELDYTNSPFFVSSTSAPVITLAPHFLTGVFEGRTPGSMQLFVDGELVSSETWQSGSVALPDGELVSGGAYTENVADFYRGEIDELRFESGPRSPAWIKLSYESQRSGQRLVSFADSP